MLCSRLVIRGFRRTLRTSDLWLLRREETTEFNRNLFAHRWAVALRKWRTEQEKVQAVKPDAESERETSGAETGTSGSDGHTESSSWSTTGEGGHVSVASAAAGDTSTYPQLHDASNLKSSASNGTLQVRFDKKEANESAQDGKEKKNKKEKKEQPLATQAPPLFRILFQVYRLPFIIAQLVMILYFVCYYLNPCLLWYLSFLIGCEYGRL